MELVENYNKSLELIYEHVGFKEDWVVYPIDDCIEMYWKVDDDSVYFSSSIEGLTDEDEDDLYINHIYKQLFYNKWIYEGKDLTMIFCDSGVDGMKYFRLFDNKKKIV
jgi:hypothetical protein